MSQPDGPTGNHLYAKKESQVPPHKVHYRVVELEYDGECLTRWDESEEPEYVIEDCAGQFVQSDYNNDWPLTFALLSEDGSESGRYTVEMEWEPSFRAVATHH